MMNPLIPHHCTSSDCYICGPRRIIATMRYVLRLPHQQGRAPSLLACWLNLSH